MNPFLISNPLVTEVPIVVSVPHCGTAFPDGLKSAYKEQYIQCPDDTDWYVHQLYDFVSTMGMTMIHATYSRWVIDLNRDPEDKPLYKDGRIITGLCPTTTFLGAPIYRDNREEVSGGEVALRKKRYYDPYHAALRGLLEEKIQKFGVVLLWDCHSIRQHVKTIYPEKFPDLILGNNDGKSASATVSQTAFDALCAEEYTTQQNFLFKGRYITRAYGNPQQNYHALQLEMTKVNYMDDHELMYDESRASRMRNLLKSTFEKLISVLTS